MVEQTRPKRRIIILVRVPRCLFGLECNQYYNENKSNQPNSHHVIKSSIPLHLVVVGCSFSYHNNNFNLIIISETEFGKLTQMDPSISQWIRPLVAVTVGSLIAFRAHRKNSLSTSGALAGFFVMSLHVFVGFRFAAMIFAFFFTSSALTKKGQDTKRLIDPEFKQGGQRNWIQVLANSGIASVLIVALWVLTEGKDQCMNSKDSALITALIGGVIGHYCCCNGDTWSSELGVLSNDRPRLITTFKPVRKGTNGGVTKTGLLAAAAGGSVIGVSYVLLELLTIRCGSDRILKQLLVIPLTTVAGLCGSIIDSLLGATLQFSGFCSIRQKVVGNPGPTVKKISGLSILDNNAVNFVSILLTTILTSVACLYIF